MPIIKYENEGYDLVFARIWGNNGPCAVDSDHEALVTLDAEHKIIHDGLSFHSGFLWGEGNTVADDAAADMLIQTGTLNLSAIGSVFIGGDGEFFLYEDVAYSDAGTIVGKFNKNRASLITTDAVISHSPTITDTGTLLASTFIPGGRGAASTGGVTTGFGREIILKASSNYLIRVINRSGTTTQVSIGVEWYEHE